jgi:DMSO/TMAO reductase YedYZ molybdopterin-dependent catalytic subunit
VPRVDPAAWRLRVGGAELTLDDLRALPQEEVDAVLDCTSLWWARQRWRGVRLDRLLDPGDAPSVEVRSLTGYALRLPAADVASMWLALEAGGRPLSPGHGFPARLVVPGRRGFWWVKWVAEIRPSPIPWWVQSPYPLT